MKVTDPRVIMILIIILSLFASVAVAYILRKKNERDMRKDKFEREIEKEKLEAETDKVALLPKKIDQHLLQEWNRAYNNKRYWRRVNSYHAYIIRWLKKGDWISLLKYFKSPDKHRMRAVLNRLGYSDKQILHSRINHHTIMDRVITLAAMADPLLICEEKKEEEKQKSFAPNVCQHKECRYFRRQAEEGCCAPCYDDMVKANCPELSSKEKEEKQPLKF